MALHQNSGAAAWDLADLWLLENNCAQAVPWLLRTEAIMETKADTRIRSRNWDSEIRNFPKTLLARCSNR